MKSISVKHNFTSTSRSGRKQTPLCLTELATDSPYHMLNPHYPEFSKSSRYLSPLSYDYSDRKFNIAKGLKVNLAFRKLRIPCSNFFHLKVPRIGSPRDTYTGQKPNKSLSLNSFTNEAQYPLIRFNPWQKQSYEYIKFTLNGPQRRGLPKNVCLSREPTAKQEKVEMIIRKLQASKQGIRLGKSRPMKIRKTKLNIMRLMKGTGNPSKRVSQDKENTIKFDLDDSMSLISGSSILSPKYR